MTKKTPAKRRGRKRLPAGEGKRVPLNMRTTIEVREKLEAAAASSGRSLTQEVEHRVTESLRQEDALLEKFGGKDTYSLMLVLSHMVQQAEFISGKAWRKDIETKRLVGKLLRQFFQDYFLHAFDGENSVGAGFGNPDFSQADRAEVQEALEGMLERIRSG